MLKHMRKSVMKTTRKVAIDKSKIWSSKAEREIAKYLKGLGYTIQEQYQIKGRPWFYDIYIPSLNLIVEYQGDHWHANPEYYRKGEKIMIRGQGVTPVEKIWAKDAAKQSDAVKNGYRYLAVWETDFQEQGVSVIDSFLRW